MSDDNSVMLLLLFFIVIIYVFYQIRFVDIKKPQTVYINKPQPIYIQPRRYRPRRYRPRNKPQKIIKVKPIMQLVRPDIKK
jgi:hypothetical protein